MGLKFLAFWLGVLATVLHCSSETVGLPAQPQADTPVPREIATGSPCPEGVSNELFAVSCTSYARCRRGLVGVIRECPAGQRFSQGWQRCLPQSAMICLAGGSQLSAQQVPVSASTPCTFEPSASGLVHASCPSGLSYDLAKPSVPRQVVSQAAVENGSAVDDVVALDWVVQNGSIPCSLAEVVMHHLAIKRNTTFSIKLNSKNSRDTLFTVLTAQRGGVETGFSPSGLLELWMETGVTNLQMQGQTLESLNVLLVGRPVNVDDPSACTIQVDLPAYMQQQVNTLLPLVYTALNMTSPDKHSISPQGFNFLECISGVVLSVASVAGILAGSSFPVFIPLAVAGIPGLFAGGYMIADGCAGPGDWFASMFGCMPGDARVLLADGTSVLVSQLQVGDRIMSGGGVAAAADPLSVVPTWSDVFLFGHADHHVHATFVSLHLKSGDVVELTPGHFIPTLPSGVRFQGVSHMYMKRAADVAVNDTVLALGRGVLVPTVVKRVATVKKWGLFNPFTLSGDLVVNGVLVSAHSDWMFDRITPAAHLHKLPAIYQAIMAPARWAYLIGGERVMRYLVDSVGIVDMASKVRL